MSQNNTTYLGRWSVLRLTQDAELALLVKALGKAAGATPVGDPDRLSFVLFLEDVVAETRNRGEPNPA